VLIFGFENPQNKLILEIRNLELGFVSTNIMGNLLSELKNLFTINKQNPWSPNFDDDNFISECHHLYEFIFFKKIHYVPYVGSGELQGMGGIPTSAGIIKIFKEMNIENIPDCQRNVLELGSSTGFSSIVYFAAFLNMNVWGCEVNKDSYLNSLYFKKYLLGKQYLEDIKKFTKNFEAKSPQSNFKMINSTYLSTIGSKVNFCYTPNNEQTLIELNKYNWKDSISIIYAFCDGVNEVDMKWHITNVWNKLKNLKYIITSKPLINIKKLKEYGFNSEYLLN
jgi:hypothetical protein